MAGEYRALRVLPDELHEKAVKLVAEVMASVAVQALTEPQELIALLKSAAPNESMVKAFESKASDFLDIRGDLVQWIIESRSDS